MNTIRVLVFGATGTGKTSVCNVLTGHNRPTSNGPLGQTSKTHRYNGFNTHDIRIEIIDTVGLHESDLGTVPAEKAVLQLVELLENSKDGFNLLIHVVRGRPCKNPATHSLARISAIFPRSESPRN